MDMMGVLPLNVIFDNYSYGYPIVIPITLLRLTRMFAINKFLIYLEKFEIQFKQLNIFMFVMKTVIILYLLWHWTSCAWFFVNRVIEPNIYDETWYSTFDMNNRNVAE